MVSILLVCSNLLPLTRRCLRSVRLWTKIPHELVVVDNGSTDGTASYLRSLPGIRRIRNERNLGFPGAINQGIERSNGRYLLFLNNDVIVSPGYLEGMLASLVRDPSVGVVGPTSNPPVGQGRSKLSYPPFYSDQRTFLQFTRRFVRRERHRLERIPPASLSCFCHLVPRAVIRRVGGMDESFAAYYEDTDFFFRVRQAGLGLARTGASFVHHFWYSTYLDQGRDVAVLAERAKERFIAKWGLSGWLVAKGFTLGGAEHGQIGQW